MRNSQNRPPYFNAVRLSFSQYVPRHKNNLVAIETRKCGKDSLYLHLSRVTAKARKIYERYFNGLSENLRRNLTNKGECKVLKIK